MRTIITLCLLGLSAMAYGKPNQYTNKYDNINLDEILNNRRLLLPYIKCLLELGKCTPEGKELKSHITEALEQDCAKCTPAQRNGTERVLGHLMNHEPEYWNELKAKYDSSGRYSAKHENELRKFKN